MAQMHTVLLAVAAATILLLPMAMADVPVITCPIAAVISNVQGCYVFVDPMDLLNATSSDEFNVTANITAGTRLPVGVASYVLYTATNNDGVASCVLSVNVVATLEANYSACGEGVCDAVVPYGCVCPPGTSGEHCCYEVNGDVCGGGNGNCTAGGTCTCNEGFGGYWCCPQGLNQTDVCGGGCCTANGTCECTDVGVDGDTCLDIISEALEAIIGIDTAAVIKVIPAIGGVVVVAVGAMIYASASAGAGAGTGASSAAFGSGTFSGNTLAPLIRR